jgi:valyl-tRNA synthetase
MSMRWSATRTGAKMSKSKGNVIDPLELIDEYGADALRFTLTIMAAQGRDVKLDPARIAGYRNFGTKLWNATRFAEMNGVARNDEVWLNDAKLTVNRWILDRADARRRREITSALESYRFNDAAGAAYRFVWNTFCDWYLELLKPVFMGEDADAKAEAQAVAAFVLDEIYKLLHPMMPFITEELWERTAGEGQGAGSTLLCACPLAAGQPSRTSAGRRRDQLAGRPRDGHPLRAFRDERAGGRDRTAGRRRRQGRRPVRSACPPRLRDQAARSRRRHLVRRREAPKSSAQIVHRRGDLLSAARRL